MPRKKKKDQAPDTSTQKQTYYKSKNNRWYKKIVVEGKTRCRFVSRAEVEGSMNVPKKTVKKPSSSTKASKSTGPTGTPSPDSKPSSDSKPSPKPKPKPKRRRRKKKIVPSVE